MSAGSTLQKENEDLKAVVEKQSSQIEQLSAQVKWFQNQLFGQKSEKRFVEPSPDQLLLGQQFQEETAPAETKTVKEHQRKKRKSEDGDNQKLFFDENVVPVETIELSSPEVDGLNEGEYEVIGEKVSYRLAQRPNAYFIVKYVRKVIKLNETADNGRDIVCPLVPEGVLEKSHADVSFLAGLLIDKFAYHLPLYRQHQRLQASGIDISRAWLTQLVHRCGDLLEPIYYALVDSIRKSRVKLIDETPIKAGRKKKGKMRTAYFWPVKGDNEIAFLFFESREHRHAFEALGGNPGDDSVIVSDGYGAYQEYAKKTGIDHAQCWAHSRREFLKAEELEPKKVEEALEFMRTLWRVEKEIKEQELEGNDKLIYRVLNSRPVVGDFFKWVDEQQKDAALLPSSKLSEALNYVSKRKTGLSIFLSDPDVPIDTNELERALRVIPMGRKNWLFCWTEVGAHYVGVFQSLIVTCKMHGIDPHTYLVDVLQRISDHPKSDVQQLTPVAWKQNFANNPRGSVVDAIAERQ